MIIIVTIAIIKIGALKSITKPGRGGLGIWRWCLLADPTTSFCAQPLYYYSYYYYY